VIFSSSSCVGILIETFLDGFDIVADLTANDSLLSVISSIIDPGQRRIPIEISSRSLGNPVLTEIDCVLFRVKDDTHSLL
jgi:hypothetical protein